MPCNIQVYPKMDLGAALLRISFFREGGARRPVGLAVQFRASCLKSAMPTWWCENRRRRPVWNGRNTKIPAVLLLDGGDIDDANFEIRRFGVDGRYIQDWVHFINLPLELFVDATERSIIADGDIDTAFVRAAGCS